MTGKIFGAKQGEPKLWEHQPDIELVLKQLEQAEGQRTPASCSSKVMPFAVNRFCMHPVNIMMIATFWRMMSGLMEDTKGPPDLIELVLNREWQVSSRPFTAGWEFLLNHDAFGSGLLPSNRCSQKLEV